MIKRELLLILKTNNYLRSIDKRLGNPNNTYNTINNITWDVYCRDLAKLDRWDYMNEVWKYYTIKVLLLFNLWKIRFFGMLGYKASPEELMDFDPDFNS